MLGSLDPTLHGFTHLVETNKSWHHDSSNQGSYTAFIHNGKIVSLENDLEAFKK